MLPTRQRTKSPPGKDMVTLPILTVTQSFRPVPLAKLSGNVADLRNFSDSAELTGNRNAAFASQVAVILAVRGFRERQATGTLSAPKLSDLDRKNDQDRLGWVEHHRTELLTWQANSSLCLRSRSTSCESKAFDLFAKNRHSRISKWLGVAHLVTRFETPRNIRSFRRKMRSAPAGNFLNRLCILCPSRSDQMNQPQVVCASAFGELSNNRGKNMKNWAMLLACGMVAFAIGCGDGGGEAAKSNPNAEAEKAKAMDAMKSKMEAGGGVVAPGGAAPAGDAAAGEKKEDPAAEKKEDAPAEKKEDAPAEKKEDAPAEKKEDAPAEKKE
ncbi:MAG: hypothetical protein FD138_3750 [Planctomycetota bacterium]|nr:MAG: hypothetical protein FD138_3750 [Planctomycetota bacterium]